jgi:hypothetical protein
MRIFCFFLNVTRTAPLEILGEEKGEKYIKLYSVYGLEK